MNKSNKTITALVIWFGLFILFVTSAFAQDRKALIYFCNLPVSEAAHRGNRYFTETYRLVYANNGATIDVKETEALFTKEEDVLKCVREWKLTGFPERSLIVLTFKWEHGVGWTEMTFRIKGLFQRITQRVSER